MSEKTIAQRIAEKVQQGAPGSCWPWTGSRRGNYGVIEVCRNGRRIRIGAHRAAWEIANERTVPDGLLVCHRCDNPPCCNPAHLFLGTNRDNMVDAFQKGRLQPPIREPAFAAELREKVLGAALAGEKKTEIARRLGVSVSWCLNVCRDAGVQPRPHVRGERVGGARLTSDQVRDIRRRAALNEDTARLASEYGVDRRNIWSIVQRRTWRHVAEPCQDRPNLGTSPRVSRRGSR